MSDVLALQYMLKGKHIVLGISGGIAAYKSVMLLRLSSRQEPKCRW